MYLMSGVSLDTHNHSMTKCQKVGLAKRNYNGLLPKVCNWHGNLFVAILNGAHDVK